MKDIVRGAHFREVDAAPAPHALLATLDAVAAREGVRRLKRCGLDMLAVTAGQRLLDVGCGMGDDVRALADLTGPSGLVVGVEPSEVLLAEARRRAADSPLPLGFAAGYACDLPFPAGSFDACRAERVFQHVPDPLRALTEMIRVTRPGGRVLVLDTDWGTTAVSGADPGRNRSSPGHGHLVGPVAVGAGRDEMIVCDTSNRQSGPARRARPGAGAADRRVNPLRPGRVGGERGSGHDPTATRAFAVRTAADSVSMS
jgi:SAM-dependent methyltransferase